MVSSLTDCHHSLYFSRASSVILVFFLVPLVHTDTVPFRMEWMAKGHSTPTLRVKLCMVEVPRARACSVRTVEFIFVVFE